MREDGLVVVSSDLAMLVYLRRRGNGHSRRGDAEYRPAVSGMSGIPEVLLNRIVLSCEFQKWRFFRRGLACSLT